MDLTVKLLKVQDTSVYDDQGKRTPVRRYTYFIGSHGPFPIDVPITDPFDENAATTKIQKLKQHLAIAGA